jgi:predicted nucleic acid-binding protein
MTTLVAEPTFLDTNILIYASIAEAPWHTAALSAIQRREQAGIELWISRQVLREYLAALSRAQVFTPPIPITTLITEIRAFEDRFQIAEDGPQITANLLKLLEQVSVGGKQVHDANIVATMQAYDLNHLLTHNTADFDRFASYITVAPLEWSSA